MMSETTEQNDDLIVVHFLIPVFDRKGNPYPRNLNKGLQGELEDRFGGWSLIGDKPAPGGWVNPETGEREEDLSLRYEVGIKANQINELDEFLSTIASKLGQEAIWRVIFGEARGKAIFAKENK